jgi:putative peptidoglycan lipid II flippase
MDKKILLKKILSLGIFTVLSRGLGFFRQLLRANFLGSGAIADALLIASKLPNSLYKIFSEGPVNAILIPFAIKIESEKGARATNQVIVFSFFLVQIFFVLLYMASYAFASLFIKFIAPGWFINCADCSQQISIAVQTLPLFMISVFFFSANSFLAAALQIKNNFFLTALQPILMNILFVSEFLIGIFFEFSPLWIANFYIINGIAVFLISMIAYSYHFSFFIIPDAQTWHYSKKMIMKLIPCYLNMGLLELNNFIDTQFISFLSTGNIAVFSYAAAFMRLPLDLFATLFSTITLPMLAKLSISRKKRLPFYLLETAKLFFWFCMPAMMLLIFFASDIFGTLLYSVFTPEQQLLASHLLIAAALGLFFFAINRNILNIYYALHETLVPTLVSIATIAINVALNFLMIYFFGAVGVVLSTTLASIIQTCMLLLILRYRFNFKIYLKEFGGFALRYLAQLTIVSAIFFIIYRFLRALMPFFLVYKWGLWFWVGPLALALIATLYATRRLFNVKLYFLEF